MTSLGSKKAKKGKQKQIPRRKSLRGVQIKEEAPSLTESQLMLLELEKMKMGGADEESTAQAEPVDSVSMGTAVSSASKKAKKKAKGKKSAATVEESEPNAVLFL